MIWVWGRKALMVGGEDPNREEKNTSLAVCGKPCLFILTMDSQIIFSSTIEADTWKICFHTAPKAGEPHPKPKLASPCTISSRVGESEQCVAFVNPPPSNTHFSFFYCLPPFSKHNHILLSWEIFPSFHKRLNRLSLFSWYGEVEGVRDGPAGGFSHNDNISLKKFMTPVERISNRNMDHSAW